MMLTEKQEKLIRAYCILPIIYMAAFAAELLICAELIVLVMIDDIGFANKSFQLAQFSIYIAIVVILLILCLYGMIRPRYGMKKKAWTELVERLNEGPEGYGNSKDLRGAAAASVGLYGAGSFMERSGKKAVRHAGAAAKAVGAVLGVGVLAAIGAGLRANAKAVADAYGIPIPKAKKYVLLILFLPFLILLVAFIPEFMSSSGTKNMVQETAAAAVYEVVDTLHAGCAYVTYTDPMEQYSSNYYSVFGHLYDWDEDKDSYVCVHVGTDGTIQEISYWVFVDVTQEQEANLERAIADISTLQSILSQTNTEATEGILDYYEFPEDFTETYLSGTAYEECKASAFVGDIRVYASYDTVSEENYTEYSSSYILHEH